MKLKTLNRIIEWIEKYQPNLSKKEWAELYSELIYEEYEELKNAIKEKNLVETLDAVWDLLWVKVWEIYFKWDDIELYYNEINATKSDLTIYLEWPINVDNLLDELINEIADSNFTKSFELQTEGEKVWKVVKWPNFKKPDIQKIIDKYDITFIN